MQNKTIQFSEWTDNFESIKKEERYIVLFTGSVDQDGVSWCSDCNDAKIFIKSHVEVQCGQLGLPFMTVCAGQRDEWKDQNNVLRKDPKLGLTNIPTLLYYVKGKIQRKLVEGQICNEALLLSFFDE